MPGVFDFYSPADLGIDPDDDRTFDCPSCGADLLPAEARIHDPAPEGEQAESYDAYVDLDAGEHVTLGHVWRYVGELVRCRACGAVALDEVHSDVVRDLQTRRPATAEELGEERERRAAEAAAAAEWERERAARIAERPEPAVWNDDDDQLPF